MFQSQNWDVAGLNSIKKTQKCWSLPATARRKLAISDPQVGCEPWRAAGLLAHKMWGWVHNGLHGMWRLNRWTFQHRFSSFHLGLEMDAIYIYDIINRVSPHTLIGGRICCEGKGLISEWWMISADVQTITNSTASWFHNASHMIHMPFPSLVILWSSMIFMGFFSKLSHQGPSFPAVWTSVPPWDHRISTAGHLSNFPI